MRLQHVDGSVLIHGDGDGSYQADVATFKREYGEDFPPLPAGVTERFYDPGVRHTLKQGTDVVDGGPMPWPAGDAILTQVTKLLQRQGTRRHYDGVYWRMMAEQAQTAELDEVKRRHEAEQARVAEQTAEQRAAFDAQQAEAAALAAENQARYDADQAKAAEPPSLPPPLPT